MRKKLVNRYHSLLEKIKVHSKYDFSSSVRNTEEGIRRTSKTKGTLEKVLVRLYNIII